MAKYLDEAGVRKLWTKTKEKANDAERNAVATAGSYTVNGQKISSNPKLSKGDVGLGNVTNEAQIPLSQRGVANGVATLGTDGKVPTSQLPSYVDDVLEGTLINATTFQLAEGQQGGVQLPNVIYVDTSTNKTYRWSGTAYTEISASLALGETSSTAYAGDKGATLATKVSALETTVGNIPDIVVTDVSTTPSLFADQVSINVSSYDRATSSDLSASVRILAATSSAAGVMSKADKAKLDTFEKITNDDNQDILSMPYTQKISIGEEGDNTAAADNKYFVLDADGIKKGYHNSNGDSTETLNISWDSLDITAISDAEIDAIFAE